MRYKDKDGRFFTVTRTEQKARFQTACNPKEIVEVVTNVCLSTCIEIGNGEFEIVPAYTIRANDESQLIVFDSGRAVLLYRVT